MKQDDDIVNAIIDLRKAFVSQGGEVLQITLDKKGREVLDKICTSFYKPRPTCPSCGNIINDMILGIKFRWEDEPV